LNKKIVCKTAHINYCKHSQNKLDKTKLINLCDNIFIAHAFEYINTYIDRENINSKYYIIKIILN
jgi:hypothetical protein